MKSKKYLPAIVISLIVIGMFTVKIWPRAKGGCPASLIDDGVTVIPNYKEYLKTEKYGMVLNRKYAVYATVKEDIGKGGNYRFWPPHRESKDHSIFAFSEFDVSDNMLNEDKKKALFDIQEKDACFIVMARPFAFGKKIYITDFAL